MSEKTPLLTCAENEQVQSQIMAAEACGVEDLLPVDKPAVRVSTDARSGHHTITTRHLHRRFRFRRRTRMIFTTGAIFCATFLERITYFSVVGNLVLFCTNTLNMSSTVAVTVNLVFTGLCYTVPLFGGRIADLVAGRFNTLYGSYLIALVGTALFPLVAINYPLLFGRDTNGRAYDLSLGFKQGYFITGLVLYAIGAGGIKANISPFGAQQVEWLGEDAVHSFFNWYYWSVNIGGCIAYLVVIYVQQEIGFDVGYGISVAALLVAIVIFLIPRNYYREHRHGNSVGPVMSILWYGTFGYGNLRNKSDSDDSSQSYSTMSSPSSTDGADVINKPMRYLDRAKQSCGGHFNDDLVEEVRAVLKTLPIFLTLIMYQAFLAQNSTTMLLQGMRMDATVGGAMIPAAALNFAKMLIITLLIPLLDRIVFPFMARFGRQPTLLHRLGCGQLAGVIAMILMGITEVFRKAELASSGGFEQDVGGTAYVASYMSLLWQIPQFVLSGVAEAFTSVAAYEFAYTEAPVAMQGMVMGFNHLATGLGALVSSAIYNIVATVTQQHGDAWLPNEINSGHLDWFSFLFAALLLVNFVVFIILARLYEYTCLGVADPTPETPATPFANSGEHNRRPSFRQ